MNRRLLLVGGGHSHVEVIRRWGLAPLPGVAVTLVSPDRHAPYSGMLPGHIAGHYSHGDCHIDLDALCAGAGVTRIAASVARLDLVNRVAQSDRAPDLPFDVLSVDTGSTPVLARIPGAGCIGLPVKPVAPFLEQWSRLLDAARAATVPLHIVVVGAGAAGVEMVLAMRHRMARDSGRARFTLLGNEPVILGSHPTGVRRRFMALLAASGITVRLGAPVERAMPGMLLLPGNERLAFDEVIWITGAAAPAWPRASGLQTDAAGFIVVDAHLQSLSHPGVFAAGDVASMPHAPRPKSGVYAVRQGPPLTENLRRALRGEPLVKYHPQPRALALISAGDRYAVASYGPFALAGAWAWRWKDHIDTAFMQRYRATSGKS
jgi:selenide,water dikinase